MFRPNNVSKLSRTLFNSAKATPSSTGTQAVTVQKRSCAAAHIFRRNNAIHKNAKKSSETFFNPMKIDAKKEAEAKATHLSEDTHRQLDKIIESNYPGFQRLNSDAHKCLDEIVKPAANGPKSSTKSTRRNAQVLSSEATQTETRVPDSGPPHSSSSLAHEVVLLHTKAERGLDVRHTTKGVESKLDTNQIAKNWISRGPGLNQTEKEKSRFFRVLAAVNALVLGALAEHTWEISEVKEKEKALESSLVAETGRALEVRKTPSMVREAVEAARETVGKGMEEATRICEKTHSLSKGGISVVV